MSLKNWEVNYLKRSKLDLLPNIVCSTPWKIFMDLVFDICESAQNTLGIFEVVLILSLVKTLFFSVTKKLFSKVLLCGLFAKFFQFLSNHGSIHKCVAFWNWKSASGESLFKAAPVFSKKMTTKHNDKSLLVLSSYQLSRKNKKFSKIIYLLKNRYLKTFAFSF